MKRVVLHDIDSRVPNLALMKLSAHYRNLGWEVRLSRPRVFVRGFALQEADLHLASTVFNTDLLAGNGQIRAFPHGIRFSVARLSHGEARRRSLVKKSR